MTSDCTGIHIMNKAEVGRFLQCRSSGTVSYHTMAIWFIQSYYFLYRIFLGVPWCLTCWCMVIPHPFVLKPSKKPQFFRLPTNKVWLDRQNVLKSCLCHILSYYYIKSRPLLWFLFLDSIFCPFFPFLLVPFFPSFSRYKECEGYIRAVGCPLCQASTRMS